MHKFTSHWFLRMLWNLRRKLRLYLQIVPVPNCLLQFNSGIQKFGSIKRVDKCWIITVKGLESWRFERQPFVRANRGIGQFGKYHNTFCLSPQILQKHCFQFLLGITMARRENKNNAYARFGGTNKEYYGIFRTGLLGVFWFIWECRAPLPLVEIWSHVFVNKLEEWEAFINSLWRECTQLKDQFLFEIFAAFCVPVV